jgi:hypothetical protein
MKVRDGARTQSGAAFSPPERMCICGAGHLEATPARHSPQRLCRASSARFLACRAERRASDAFCIARSAARRAASDS